MQVAGHNAAARLRDGPLGVSRQPHYRAKSSAALSRSIPRSRPLCVPCIQAGTTLPSALKIALVGPFFVLEVRLETHCGTGILAVN